MLIHRIWTALLFAPALLALVWWGGLVLKIACLVIVALMLWEFGRLVLGMGERGWKAVGFGLAALVSASVFAWVPAHWTQAVLPVAAMVLMVATVLRPDPIEESVRRAGLVSFGVLYTAGLLPFLALLRDVDESGLGLSLAALFCAWGADTGAYFVGKYLGKRKLYPKVSPGKTIEGAMGGLASAVVVAFFIGWAFGLDIDAIHLVCIGGLAASLGMLGDLFESLVKRSVGAKDSSRLIPGHGGVLDRFDGVMFAAPGIYTYVVVVL